MKPHTHKGLVVALVLAGPWPGSCCPGSHHFRSSGPRAYGDTFQVKIVAGVVVHLDTPLFSQALAAFSSPSSATVFFTSSQHTFSDGSRCTYLCFALALSSVLGCSLSISSIL